MVGPSTQPVPSWLVNLAELGWRLIVIALLAVVVLWLFGVFWVVTASIAVGIVISAVFAPAVLRLREQGRSRNSAALIVWTVAVLTIGAVVVVLGLAFVPYIADLLRAVESAITTVEGDLAAIGIPPVAGDALMAAFQAIRDGGAIASLLGSVASAATIVLLAIFLVFFFLRDGDKGWLWLFQGLGEEKRAAATVAGHDALLRVGGYLRGTTVLAAVVAVTDFLFMIVLGVPLALPLALFAFLAVYIPYLGGLLATIAILLVTLAEHGPTTALVMLILLVVRNFLVNYGLRPSLYSRTVSIHPALVLIVLPAGFELGGIVGLFAAVPLTAVVLTGARTAIAIVNPDPAPPTPALVPPWLDRIAQHSWRLLVLIGLCALAVGFVVTLPLVVIPIIGGLILAATLAPLATFLERRGSTRGMASALTVVGTLAAITVMMALATLSLVGSAPGINDTVNAGAATVNDAAGGQLGLAEQSVGAFSIATVSAVLAFGDNLAGVAAMALLATLLAYYFLKDGGRLWSRLIGAARPDVVDDVSAAGTRAFEALSGYMLGTAAISLVGATSQLAIMVILGLPHALPVFVLSFFLGFIPYIGGYISTGIAFLIAVSVGSPATIILMFIWTMVFNIVQGSILAPIVYGKAVSIHPAVVLLAIPAGAAVAGILGMFIAIPVAGVVVATWRTALALLGIRARSLSAGPRGTRDVEASTA